MSVSVSPQLIEDVVQGVLAQLAKREDSRLQANAESTPLDENATATAHAALRLTASVITEAVLEDALKQHAGLVIPAKAIITPAARDVIRRRGLAVERCNSTGMVGQAGSCGPQGLPHLLLILQPARALTRAVARLQAGWRCEWPMNLQNACELVNSELMRGGVNQVLLLTNHPHHAACALNRNPSVTAVAIRDSLDVKSIRSEGPVNTWCLNSAERPWYELLPIFRRIVQPAGRNP